MKLGTAGLVPCLGWYLLLGPLLTRVLPGPLIIAIDATFTHPFLPLRNGPALPSHMPITTHERRAIKAGAAVELPQVDKIPQSDRGRRCWIQTPPHCHQLSHHFNITILSLQTL